MGFQILLAAGGVTVFLDSELNQKCSVIVY